jgi:hypothetical protein
MCESDCSDHHPALVNKPFTTVAVPANPPGSATDHQGGTMLIFWEQRLVFLATPKAGSTAVEMALDPLSSASLQRPALLKHTDIGTFRRHLGPWLEAQAGEPFTTVALMREPVDWLRSWYRFKQRDELDEREKMSQHRGFADFASAYAKDGGSTRTAIGTQADFLTTKAGRVDRIFRYEAIDDFVEFLENRLDCVIELPRINVPPTADVHLDLAAETLLRSAMVRDLDLYHALS